MRLGKPLVEIRPVPADAAEEERRRIERKARDIELLNRYADELNAQAEEILEYQADIFVPPSKRSKKSKKLRGKG